MEDLHGHHLFGRLIQAFGHLTEDTAAHQLQHAVLARIAGENIADFKEKKTVGYHQLSKLHKNQTKVQANFHQTSKSVHFNFAALYSCNIDINNNINNDNNTLKSTFVATQGHVTETEYRVINPTQDNKNTV